MSTALLFPGQGSQRVGMGRELAREFEPARRAFEEADDALGASISRLCFEGPEAELVRTENTQPALLTCSTAVLRVLEAERGLTFDVAAGHSLGEWSALVAAGALTLADAVRLVRLRGRAMQEAVPQGQGAMAAIIGLGQAEVEELCRSAAQGEVLSPANLNGAGQTVISGHAGAVERGIAAARAAGAQRAVALQVSAPFHCALMQPAADRLAEALAGVAIAPLRVPVVANVDAQPNQDPGKVVRLLVAQVTAPVRWEESVMRLATGGTARAFELGAGSVLRGLVKRIAKTIQVTSVGEPADVK
ncbi:MAG TPA: ACP S-malonyltransferase, partial [Candidatus Acidoferrum sp.]|nr:ACP S-malonyltransferase [Candidatus Acidoferrum sp.]